MLLMQGGFDLVKEGMGSGLLDAELLGKCRNDEGGVADCRQPDKADAIGQVLPHLLRDLDGQASLAHSTGTDQGEQTYLGALQEGTNRGRILLAPNERGELHGQSV